MSAFWSSRSQCASTQQAPEYAELWCTCTYACCHSWAYRSSHSSSLSLTAELIAIPADILWTCLAPTLRPVAGPAFSHAAADSADLSDRPRPPESERALAGMLLSCWVRKGPLCLFQRGSLRSQCRIHAKEKHVTTRSSAKWLLILLLHENVDHVLLLLFAEAAM